MTSTFALSPGLHSELNSRIGVLAYFMNWRNGKVANLNGNPRAMTFPRLETNRLRRKTLTFTRSKTILSERMCMTLKKEDDEVGRMCEQ